MKDAKEKIKRMYPPKQKNVERLEKYIEKLKEEGQLREHDV
jgi:hypothetical protein